jgi:endonuclease IV
MIVHPDALTDFGLWREFGSLLCIENMDKRKPLGRTARELDAIFRELPDASLCFDFGHARQCDATMAEAHLILREFGDRLSEVHVSEVSTSSRHGALSFLSVRAFQQVAHLIGEGVPLILETPVPREQMREQMGLAQEALPLSRQALVA